MAESMSRARQGLYGLLLMLGGAALGAGGLYLSGAAPARSPAPEKDAAQEPSERDADHVDFPESRWAAANLTLQPVTRKPLIERTRRSGRVALDEERLAHVASPLEGVIHEVRVRLGQEVQAGDVLAVLDIRELAQAKLELVKARTVRQHATEHLAWATSSRANAEELLGLVEKDAPPAEIDARLKSKPIGEFRQTLMAAYVKRLQLRGQFDAVSKVGREAMSESGLKRLQADLEAADAAYASSFEEGRHKARHEAHLAEQKWQEARAAEAIARTQLQLLGFTPEAIDALDPIAEGKRASLYELRSPLGGTVIERHAVRSERVTPQTQLFQVADLSRVWIQADVFESDLPWVRNLRGKPVRFRSRALSEAVSEAEVFYPGDVLDRGTRAMTLTAVAMNPDRLLKPGMLVEVELTRPAGECVQVPPTAVMRLGAQPVVFVHEGGGKFRKVEVQLGRELEDAVEVRAGLEPGQRVVATGGFLLKTELLREQLAGE